MDAVGAVSLTGGRLQLREWLKFRITYLIQINYIIFIENLSWKPILLRTAVSG